ncbi:hypothetical protein GWI33_021354 [Rhynchophorus ferrugineus]|uniref:Uncharacterized protein n=1 Tax=Rhynchophorus ferrugineus TaxID=354439 RepID=A0A834HQ28_RHYFE|nr:hypothetical protein GWI33_021354 [Rhynchophorus ferrugineus]
MVNRARKTVVYENNSVNQNSDGSANIYVVVTHGEKGGSLCMSELDDDTGTNDELGSLCGNKVHFPGNFTSHFKRLGKSFNISQPMDKTPPANGDKVLQFTPLSWCSAIIK